MSVLSTANALAALLSAGSSAAGVLRPGLALPAGEPATAGVHLYARAYAARALPLGVATAAAVWTGGAAAGPLLLVSGLAQVADSAIGFRQRNLGMGIGAGACAVLHLLSAWWVTR
ncbi:hypothetical protein [Kitasatospora sp. NPDC057198]|uniref:hypothetical protein n=1 Tax=Kitasatospora sp. NPDC057198 TaxID=3346046 RepID=UPI0036367DAD